MEIETTSKKSHLGSVSRSAQRVIVHLASQCSYGPMASPRDPLQREVAFFNPPPHLLNLYGEEALALGPSNAVERETKRRPSQRKQLLFLQSKMYFPSNYIILHSTSWREALHNSTIIALQSD